PFRDYQMAQVALYVVAIAGLTVLVGLSGQISIGNGAFMAVGAYAAALLVDHLAWPLAAVLAASAAITALAGLDFGVAAAGLPGLNVAVLRVLAFVISAACAGLAGALLGVTTTLVSPGSFTVTLSIALLTGAVLGGLGSLAGAVWGSLVIVLVPTYITD